jgi:hypothetical protein
MHQKSRHFFFHEKSIFRPIFLKPLSRGLADPITRSPLLPSVLDEMSCYDFDDDDDDLDLLLRVEGDIEGEAKEEEEEDEAPPIVVAVKKKKSRSAALDSSSDEEKAAFQGRPKA